jgi:hypothetical protein
MACMCGPDADGGGDRDAVHDTRRRGEALPHALGSRNPRLLVRPADDHGELFTAEPACDAVRRQIGGTRLRE